MSGVSGRNHPGKVSLDRGVWLEVELLHQHVKHGRGHKRRKFRAERDILLHQEKEVREARRTAFCSYHAILYEIGRSLMPTPKAFGKCLRNDDE